MNLDNGNTEALEVPKGRDKEVIGVVISKEMKERLTELAKKKRWSLSQTAAILIEQALELEEYQQGTDKDVEAK